MKFDIRINGEDFGRRVDACVEELLARMKKGLENACLEVEDEAVARCPEGTHEGADTVSLAQSIASKIDVGDSTGAKLVGTVGTGLDYGVYVHEGTGIKSRTGRGRTHDLPWSYMDEMGNWHSTSGMEANPFLEEAMKAKASRVNRIIAEAVKNG